MNNYFCHPFYIEIKDELFNLENFNFHNKIPISFRFIQLNLFSEKFRQEKSK